MVGKADHGDDGKPWGRQGVGMRPGGGGNGSCGTSPHRRVHQETAGDHSGKCGLQSRMKLEDEDLRLKSEDKARLVE